LKPIEVVNLFSENSKELVKLLKNMNQKPIITYMTSEKLPDLQETENMAK
jgi:hypothetical protein